MVPWAIVAVTALPLTVNREVARDLLPIPEVSTRTGAATADAPPLSEAARALVAIWAEILGVTAVDLDDDFFRLGGHSLSAMRVTAKVRDHLRVPVGVRGHFRPANTQAPASPPGQPGGGRAGVGRTGSCAMSTRTSMNSFIGRDPRGHAIALSKWSDLDG